MKRLISGILAVSVMCSLSAQDTEQILSKTVSRLQKDGGIAMTMDADINIDGESHTCDLLIKLSGTSFYACQEETTMWFDGKTMWRGNDFGEGIEEIYITEPTPDEKSRYDIIGLLDKHQGFNVSGNGTDTFTLTASNREHSAEGIKSVTVKVNPETFIPETLQIEFTEELGNISASVRITGYKSGQKFDKKDFSCPVRDFKDAEIIDLR